jgi:hypothetical protein
VADWDFPAAAKEKENTSRADALVNTASRAATK